MTEKIQRFLELLSSATRETGVSIGGCGCCGSPWVGEDTDIGDIEYPQGTLYWGRYRGAGDDGWRGDELGWYSAYDQCLDKHRDEWQRLHRRFCGKPGSKYGAMNTEQFGRYVLSGEAAKDSADPAEKPD